MGSQFFGSGCGVCPGSSFDDREFACNNRLCISTSCRLFMQHVFIQNNKHQAQMQVSQERGAMPSVDSARSSSPAVNQVTPGAETRAGHEGYPALQACASEDWPDGTVLFLDIFIYDLCRPCRASRSILRSSTHLYDSHIYLHDMPIRPSFSKRLSAEVRAKDCRGKSIVCASRPQASARKQVW